MGFRIHDALLHASLDGAQRGVTAGSTPEWCFPYSDVLSTQPRKCELKKAGGAVSRPGAAKASKAYR